MPRGFRYLACLLRAGLRIAVAPSSLRSWRQKSRRAGNIDVYANVNICYCGFDIGPLAAPGLISGSIRMVEEKHADLQGPGPGHAVRAQRGARLSALFEPSRIRRRDA